MTVAQQNQAFQYVWQHGETPAPKPALNPLQREINRQLGLSEKDFRKFADPFPTRKTVVPPSPPLGPTFPAKSQLSPELQVALWQMGMGEEEYLQINAAIEAAEQREREMQKRVEQLREWNEELSIYGRIKEQTMEETITTMTSAEPAPPRPGITPEQRRINAQLGLDDATFLKFAG